MKKKSKVIIMLLLTGLSILVGTYDDYNYTVALMLGLATLKIACERSEEN